MRGVGARDRPDAHAPLELRQHPVGPRARAVGEPAGAHDRPAPPARRHHALHLRLVAVDVLQQEREQQLHQRGVVVPAVAGPEAGQDHQPRIGAGVPEHAHQDLAGIGVQGRRLRAVAGAERHEDRVRAGHRTANVGVVERAALNDREVRVLRQALDAARQRRDVVPALERVPHGFEADAGRGAEDGEPHRRGSVRSRCRNWLNSLRV